MWTLLAQAAEEPDKAVNTEEFVWLLAFGVAVILIAAAVSLIKDKASSTTFMRMAGLLSIASIAGALVVLEVEGESLTAAFTVLGTIAGYLAGAKTQTTTVDPPAGRSDPGGASEDGDTPDDDDDPARNAARAASLEPTAQRGVRVTESGF